MEKQNKISNGVKNEYFEQCLKLNKIKPFSRGSALAPKELDLALADFKRGQATFLSGDFKWATVQAYYSMFHSARALLYTKNYREKSHACLIEAIRHLFATKGLISLEIIEVMINAKRLREDADYYGDYSEAVAKDLLAKAEKFYKAASRIVKV